MKRKIYIVLFTVFGLLGAWLLHILLEIAIINLLTEDFNRYGLGLSWPSWFLIHNIGSVLLEVVGLIGGIYFGRRFATYFHY